MSAPRNPFWFVRRVAKEFVILIGLGSYLVEPCEDCGARVGSVWWSPDDLWTELTGHAPVRGDNMPGLLCIRCFNNRAFRRGMILRWHPTVELRRQSYSPDEIARAEVEAAATRKYGVPDIEPYRRADDQHGSLP